ncbi:Zinc finger CCCH domain-containing protein 48 [Vitis vinifera]|uniref:Zinc finger CCCH domain-containing protein 48 n=1 Tax=Vitis vinifera TaxID=29760 RepID=A0A438GWT8_VITVI|nr:Zinc finger CCCH domain-containing protein 48 [Vitis vinifera]
MISCLTGQFMMILQAWHTQNNTELTLSGPTGQVYALVVGNDLLFAGATEGQVDWSSLVNQAVQLAFRVKWRLLCQKFDRLDQDGAILAWKFNAVSNCFEPAASLKGHTQSVITLVVGANRLYSGSMDRSIRVWVATESGNLEVTYTHNEEQGVLYLCGMHDQKPSQSFCALAMTTLSAFTTCHRIRAIQIGPGGLFFTGDGSGQVRVWNWSTEAAAPA